MSTATSIIADTTAGAVQGVRTGGVVAFLGVPYAAAPVGERRFRAPEPVAPWAGVRDAVTHGPTAPMPGYPPPFDALLPNPVVAGDEYLNLSVWTPDPGAQGLPVLVWIHGGAFVNGSSAVIALRTAPRSHGRAWSPSRINYRLGAEGFALLPDAPPNLGLLDQVAALEWVRDNITAFGGDPDAVTVAGESAGAMSIGALLAMPRAEGLFRRAILQSGAAQHTSDHGHRRAGRRLPGRRAGGARRPPRHCAPFRAERVIEAQKALTVQLQNAPDPGRWGEIVANLMMFEPVVDGDVLPAPPWQRIAAGSAAEVDVLVGANRHEYRFFLVPTGVADRVEAQAARRDRSRATGCPTAHSTATGPHTPDASPGELLAEVMTDWFFRIPALRLAESHPARSYVYEFGWESPAYDGRLGACHGLELPFVFDTAGRPRRAGVRGHRSAARARGRRMGTAPGRRSSPPATPAGLPTRRTGVPWPGSVRARIRPWRWSTIRGVTCGCCGTASADDRHHGGPR